MLGNSLFDFPTFDNPVRGMKRLLNFSSGLFTESQETHSIIVFLWIICCSRQHAMKPTEV